MWRYSSLRRFCFPSTALFAFLSIIVTAVATLAGSLRYDHELRARLENVLTPVTGRHGSESAVTLAGLDIDELRRLGLQVGASQTLEDSLLSGGRRYHVDITKIDAGLVSLIATATGRPFRLWRDDQPEDISSVAISSRLATTLFGTPSRAVGQIVRIGSRNIIISGTVVPQDEAVLRLVGLQADLYEPLGREPNWYRGSVRPFQVLILKAKGDARIHEGAALSTLVPDTASIAGREARRETRLTSVLSLTVGPWRRAMQLVLLTLGGLFLVVSAAIWTVYRDHQLSMERELWIRRTLGARWPAFLSIGARHSLLPALGGIATGLLVAFFATDYWASDWFGRAPVVVAGGWREQALTGLASAATLLGVALGVSVWWALSAFRRASRRPPELDARTSLRAGGLGSRSALVALSAAASTVLILLAAGAHESLVKLQASRLIGDTNGLVRVYVYFPLTEDYSGPDAVWNFRRDMQRRFETARALLGPLAAGREVVAGYPNPLLRQRGTTRLRIRHLGRPDAGEWNANVRRLVVSPGYFEALRLPVVWGAGCPANAGNGPFLDVVVNESFLRENAVTEEPSSLVLEDARGPEQYRIRGVVADSPRGAKADLAPATVFVCDFSNAWNFFFRPVHDPETALANATTLLAREWPQAQFDAAAVDQELEGLLGNAKLQNNAVGLLALIAVLASVAAVVSAAVLWTRSQRRSVAIRRALGATGYRTLIGLCPPVLKPLLGGVLVATVLSWWLNRWLVSSIGLTLEIPPQASIIALGLTGLGLVVVLAVSLTGALRIDVASVLRDE